MIIHMCLDVRGALKRSNAELKKWAGAITVDGRTLQTADEIRDFFIDRLQEGYERLPLADCDNFDPKQGCMGHTEKGDDIKNG